MQTTRLQEIGNMHEYISAAFCPCHHYRTSIPVWCCYDCGVSVPGGPACGTILHCRPGGAWGREKWTAAPANEGCEYDDFVLTFAGKPHIYLCAWCVRTRDEGDVPEEIEGVAEHILPDALVLAHTRNLFMEPQIWRKKSPWLSY